MRDRSESSVLHPSPANVVCIGSIKLELSGEVEPGALSSLANVYTRSPTAFDLGGTATNFARAAIEKFASVTIVAAIGDDNLSPLIDHDVSRLGCQHRLFRKQIANSWVIYLRSSENSTSGEKRLLISSQDSPHLYLSQMDIEAVAADIGRADVLVADAYALQGAVSSVALRTAFRLAATHSVPCVFDLVPHNMTREGCFGDFDELVELSDIIVSEIPTVMRLLAPGSNSQSIESVADLISARWPRKIWLIRHGYAGIELTTVLRAGRVVADYCTLYRFADAKRGFGDRLLVAELANMFTDDIMVARSKF